ncbi:MAG: inositol monophosphatase family protein [Gammaproteobacteria bacterium]
MHPMLTIAVRAARKAGDFINRNLDQVADLDVTEKGYNDFVTEVDKKAESIIIDTIRDAYPDHSFLAEESGITSNDPDNIEYQWIIDPLDGTTNFLHTFPQYAVSIALKHKGILDQAVIYDPNRSELFTATKGRGAFLDNRRIRVGKRIGLKGSLIGTGFPVRNQDQLGEYLQTFKAIFKDTAGIRRAGAASLDLAYVASGRLDGFWEMQLQPWDMAAGILLIQEAGGLVGDMQGGNAQMKSGSIVAGNPRVFKEIIQRLNRN